MSIAEAHLSDSLEAEVKSLAAYIQEWYSLPALPDIESLGT